LLMIFPLFFLLLFSPMYFPQPLEIMRARRLYRNGPMVQGKVIFAKKRTAATPAGLAGKQRRRCVCDLPISQRGTNGDCRLVYKRVAIEPAVAGSHRASPGRPESRKARCPT
jgi:hypothetical protein